MLALNEITFNLSLLKELRAIAFASKLIEQGWLKDEYRDRIKQVLIHSIRADEAMCNLNVASKLNPDWRFLCDLRDRGRAAAKRWLDENFDHVGHHATVDLRSDYLGAPAVHREHVHV
jgi:NTE family protein